MARNLLAARRMCPTPPAPIGPDGGARARDWLDPPEARRRRAALVAQIAAEGVVRDARVLDALGRVPRHAFVPRAPLDEAYGDFPVPIGWDQTISQPTVVGMMTEALELRGGERVLEIGTGCGYQTAVLAELAREVLSIEIVQPLAQQTAGRLAMLGVRNVKLRVGDGWLGWPEEAPFDRIVVTAAPDAIPDALEAQLAEGGVMVLPVGSRSGAQSLLRARKEGGRLAIEDLGPVRFVPLVHG